MKIKGLLSELDEIRAQRETAGLQSDHVSVKTTIQQLFLKPEWAVSQ